SDPCGTSCFFYLNCRTNVASSPPPLLPTPAPPRRVQYLDPPRPFRRCIGGLHRRHHLLCLFVILSARRVRTSNDGLLYTDVARSTGHGFDVALFAGFKELGPTRSHDLPALVHGIRKICLVLYLSDDC
ncbi:unnamed protein product, partial [Musa banksii]